MEGVLPLRVVRDTGQGTLPPDEVTALVREIDRGVPWQRAISTLTLPTLSRKRDWFLDPAKAAFYLSLEVPTHRLAMDVGAGSGVIACELGRRFERTIAVEQDRRWCRFMRHRFLQEGLPVEVIHVDALRLPPSLTNVDLAVVNGVLEWVATGDSADAQVGSPRQVQLTFLRAIRSVLRPGGRIGIAIENRLHFEYFRGAIPHDELPYVAVMPRWLADAVTRWRQGKPYRTWIYSARGYKRLLQEAGFIRIEFFAALPTYHHPEVAVPLDRDDAIRPYLNRGSRSKRLALQLLAAAGLLGQTVNSFYIAAERPHEMTTTEPADAHMLDGSREAGYPLTGAANWLWLAPQVGRSRALVIGEIPPLYRGGLSANFEQVESVPVTSLHDAATLDSKGNHRANLLYEDASVDCVVSTDLVNAWPASRRSPFQDMRLVAALTELRRLITPGGLLFLSGPNARWYRALLRRGTGESTRFVRSGHTGPLLHLGQARNALTRAGFSETRAYFVERSVGDAVVPACRRATMAYERERMPRTNVSLRALWAACGLYELLYPDAFILAIK